MGRGYTRPKQGNPGYAPAPADLGPGTVAANPRYAVPRDSITPGFSGWEPVSPSATELRIGADGTTPDIRRIQQWDSPPESPDPRRALYENAERVTRHAELETLHATGWEELQEYPGLAFMKHPRWRPYYSIRPTSRMGPNTYAFTRRWSIPQSTGVHFSLADHRRNFPVGGMKPQGRIGENTYRLDPAPWDADRYVVSAENVSPEDYRVISAVAPASRNYRL